MPKSERNPKAEIRTAAREFLTGGQTGSVSDFGTSEFGFLSAFGFRPSDFY
jgi:hypothetical protein